MKFTDATINFVTEEEIARLQLNLQTTIMYNNDAIRDEIKRIRGMQIKEIRSLKDYEASEKRIKELQDRIRRK
jgi:hypothetical protein